MHALDSLEYMWEAEQQYALRLRGSQDLLECVAGSF